MKIIKRYCSTIVLSACIFGSAQAVDFKNISLNEKPTPALSEFKELARSLAKATGGRIAVVAATGSMEPTLTPADVVVFAPVAQADLKIGDIIISRHVIEGGSHQNYAGGILDKKPSEMYAVNTYLVMHRVVELPSSGSGDLRTQGDANHFMDRILPPWAIEIVGRVNYAVNGQTGKIRDMRASRTGEEIPADRLLLPPPSVNEAAANN